MTAFFGFDIADSMFPANCICKKINYQKNKKKDKKKLIFQINSLSLHYQKYKIKNYDEFSRFIQSNRFFNNATRNP